MMRRRTVALFALSVVLLVAGVDARGAADVARVGNVGWWSKRPAAQPTTGPSSFEVASGVDGDESVAALRILINGSITKATLAISEAANQTTAVSVPKLQACPTDTPWVLTTSPGKYADAPKPACDKAVIALTRDDKGNWTGDITNLLQGNRSEVSVMVVPAPDKSLPVPPTFFLQFATSRVEADGTPDAAPTTTTTPRPAVVAPASGGASTSPRPAPVTAAPTPTTAAAAPTPTTAATSNVPPRLGGNLIASHPKRKQWGKLVWLVPLSTLAAAGWVYLRKALVERGTLASA